ncbi:glutamate-rich protein 1 isoform X2 [Ochotona princeps]|uniref:glutamate-rich protein 1 isoform X2 n=1 Tax=Ochotona princeps TaxID=9978 RepID=UPI00271525A8|nr:glutamate-rich protein 1 isoform X2 [Ochotona princeps]
MYWSSISVLCVTCCGERNGHVGHGDGLTLDGPVFVEKVLKRLYPPIPSGQEQKTSERLASEGPQGARVPEAVRPTPVQPVTDGDTRCLPERRFYTVSLPPDGYLPNTPSCLDSASVSTGEEAEGKTAEDPNSKSEQWSCHVFTHDQDCQDQPKRKRIRKHKSRKNVKKANIVHVKQAELEKQPSLLQEKLQHQHTDGPSISKNKKRKLKKKRQIKRKKAAGLVTKASGVNFMYQPMESHSEQENEGYSERGARNTSEEEEAGDADEEEVRFSNEKADGVLALLKSMQEAYFYDGLSRDLDPTVCVETTEELLRCLESRCLPPTDVFILDHMRTLLLLQDTERLASALQIFPEHCAMPPDHAKVISAFFNYWITHVLPEKSSD